MFSRNLGCGFVLVLSFGCQHSAADSEHDTDALGESKGSDEIDAGGGADAGHPGKPGKTFYGDVLPLLETHCIGCHQDTGIAPFALDSLASAKAHAAEIAAATKTRSMPPWAAVSDDSCGTFKDSLALDDEAIATFEAWAKGDLALGDARAIEPIKVNTLKDATTVQTPLFSPTPEGTDYAENDEYRCFMIDAPNAEPRFISGYSVTPGTAEIVHHVVAFIVDPAADSDIDGKTNGALMAELDAASPDRDGWSCFGAAGDGVAIVGSPVVWAPGQGVVEFPAGSGTPLTPTQKLVVQVHYNLEDPRSAGKSDQTSIQFQLTDKVDRVGMFLVPDQFLASYFAGKPEKLEPGKESVKFRWTQSMSDLGVDQIPDLQLAGIMPHMHELGHRYQMSVSRGDDAQCGVSVLDWDFHWQRMYFYEEPIALTPDTNLEVTCDYDTLSRTEPVLPGWGTQNEMCTAILYVTAPLSAFGG